MSNFLPSLEGKKHSFPLRFLLKFFPVLLFLVLLILQLCGKDMRLDSFQGPKQWDPAEPLKFHKGLQILGLRNLEDVHCKSILKIEVAFCFPILNSPTSCSHPSIHPGALEKLALSIILALNECSIRIFIWVITPLTRARLVVVKLFLPFCGRYLCTSARSLP